MDYITADEKKVLMDKLDRWSIVMHSKVDGQRFVIEGFDYNHLLVGIRKLLPNDKLDIRIRWVDPEDIFVIKNGYRVEETYGFNSSRMNIKNVIFNDPATIVFWSDGSKTVVKAHLDDYDPEKGLAMAIAKKALGNEGNYYNVFKKWLPKEDSSKETRDRILNEIAEKCVNEIFDEMIERKLEAFRSHFENDERTN